MSEMSIDQACKLLSEAASGTFTINADFKAACKKAVYIMRQAEKLAGYVADDHSEPEK